jgi:hypothetical protein
MAVHSASVTPGISLSGTLGAAMVQQPFGTVAAGEVFAIGTETWEIPAPSVGFSMTSSGFLTDNSLASPHPKIDPIGSICKRQIAFCVHSARRDEPLGRLTPSGNAAGAAGGPKHRRVRR